MAEGGQKTPATPGGISAASALAAGQRVGAGRYTLIRQLGQGGMGVVWLAKDEELGDEVALKFLCREISHDSETLDELRRETLKSRKLTHPNIIRIHDLHRVQGEAPFISMEYVAGQSLSKFKAEQPQRCFNWDYLKPLVKQLCDALDYAHEEHVIHRDLKPANLMLDAKGRLKLADFGLAAVASESMSRVSLQHTTSGTPAYMSPQQMDGRPPRVTDDIYALGATLYELLTSKPPFYHGDILHQVRNLPPDPLEQRLAEFQLTNNIPPDVATLIMACLAKNPEQRPQSAGAVAEWIGITLGTERKGLLLGSLAEPGTAKSAPKPDHPLTRPADTLSPSDGERDGVRGPSDASPGPSFIGSQPDQVEPEEEHDAPAEAAARNRPRLWIGVAVATLAVVGIGGWFMVAKQNGAKTQGASSAADAASGGNAPTNMTLIPAGPFQMGDSFGEERTNKRPASAVAVHTVQVSAFYIDKYEVTKALWDEVYRWAISHGYSFEKYGSSKDANHPVRSINWFDSVKWCNARSEKEGRVPAYYTSAAQTTVYRSGQVDVQNDWVKWNAGYRLPTEAEWEKAARGGLSGKRFPWGDTISHSQANYNSTNTYAFDVNPTRGFHPIYAAGEQPYTSPVGVFAANGYGLYDMAGNVREWCWDQFGTNYYTSSPASDPRGPVTGTKRVFRGGDWYYNASSSQSGYRYSASPGGGDHATGFRSVLPAGQASVVAKLEAKEPQTEAKVPALAAVLPAPATLSSGQRWTNTLGMVFTGVPGTPALFSIWETRVQDYEAFVKATGRSWRSLDSAQGPTHPAMHVSWDDAKAFCQWLTEKERSERKLVASQSYRLPTDAEWSLAVGLPKEDGATPEAKNGKIKGVYPWGNQWPPPKGAENYDSSLGVDSFENTAPVGSFAANRYGLYDLGGNAQEWCEDFYAGQSGSRVLRGGDFTLRGNSSRFLASNRKNNSNPNYRNDNYGIRCVVGSVGGSSP